MSAYRRSLGNGPPNQVKIEPYGQNPVACRLCDRVLNSTQALSARIETHLDLFPARPNQQQYHPRMMLRPEYDGPFLFQDPGFRRRFSQPELFPSPEPNLNLPLSGGSTRSANIGRRVAPATAGRGRPGRPAKNKVPVKRPRQAKEVKWTRNLTTKPLLRQLNRPIPIVIDLDSESEDAFDLELKL